MVKINYSNIKKIINMFMIINMGKMTNITMINKLYHRGSNNTEICKKIIIKMIFKFQLNLQILQHNISIKSRMMKSYGQLRCSQEWEMTKVFQKCILFHKETIQCKQMGKEDIFQEHSAVKTKAL